MVVTLAVFAVECKSAIVLAVLREQQRRSRIPGADNVIAAVAAELLVEPFELCRP